MAKKPKKDNKRKLNKRLNSWSYLPLEAENGSDSFVPGAAVTVTRGAGGLRWEGALVEVTGRFGYAKVQCKSGPKGPEQGVPVANEDMTVVIGDPMTEPATPDVKVDIYNE